MNANPTPQAPRSLAGKVIFISGVAVTIAFLIWGRTGVYTSQLIPFQLVGAVGVGAMWFGARMARDPHHDDAADWHRSPPPE